MISLSQALSVIPDGLRNPLISEFNNIVNNFLERKWLPAELSGGRFCEIVYTILDGFASGTYKATPEKPGNFVNACRSLESNNHVPRSFQILIPRILPALYEIRNNRNVGHVGGDVDSNYMDSSIVLSFVNWIMAELIRVYHNVTISEAQYLVELLTEKKIPLVWVQENIRRVLNPKMSQKDQILLLLSSSSNKVSIDHLSGWLDTDNKTYLKKILKKLHNDRLIELDINKNEIQILPPGSDYINSIIKKYKT